jgi:hypothetical protein
MTAPGRFICLSHTCWDQQAIEVWVGPSSGHNQPFRERGNMPFERLHYSGT